MASEYWLKKKKSRKNSEKKGECHAVLKIIILFITLFSTQFRFSGCADLPRHPNSPKRACVAKQMQM